MDEVLARAGIFQGVEPGAVDALTKDLHEVDYPRGHVIFNEGEPGDRLYIILSGKVKLGRRSPDGRENLLSVMGPSDMFGEMSIFDPGPRTSSATCITEVRAMTMDREALRAWIRDRPEIAEQLLRVLARRLRRTNNNLADLIFTDVPGRVAKQLLQLAQRFGTQEGGAVALTSPTQLWSTGYGRLLAAKVVLTVVLVALAMAFLATIYPAWRASRTAPAEALVVFGPVVVSPGLATHSHTGSPTAPRVSVSFGVEALSGASSPIWETAVCASSAGST